MSVSLFSQYASEKKIRDLDKVAGDLGTMDVPVLNKGAWLYTAKLNVTGPELAWVLEHRWHKLRGQPWSKEFGNLYDLVASWRGPGEVLYSDEGLVPVMRLGKCVAYAQVDPGDHHDLMRFEWLVGAEGYAHFQNRVLGVNISMHRYVMDFPVGLAVDHIRWNRLDNRRAMLRPCTIAENNRNMSYRRPI